MPGEGWWPWHEGPHRHCDCGPVTHVVTVTITDAAGNVRAVRDGEFFVRPHRHHGRHEHAKGM